MHGTASSPFRWADMVNDLLEDKAIRDHFEFWFFTYNTGNPIPISANILRHSLQSAVQSLGGVQADPALGRMVMIGHSQGGLLTKMMVDRSWQQNMGRVQRQAAGRAEPKAENQGAAEGVAVHPSAAVR